MAKFVAKVVGGKAGCLYHSAAKVNLYRDGAARAICGRKQARTLIEES
jgi:hypothetical protein